MLISLFSANPVSNPSLIPSLSMIIARGWFWMFWGFGISVWSLSSYFGYNSLFSSSKNVIGWYKLLLSCLLWLSWFASLHLKEFILFFEDFTELFTIIGVFNRNCWLAFYLFSITGSTLAADWESWTISKLKLIFYYSIDPVCLVTGWYCPGIMLLESEYSNSLLLILEVLDPWISRYWYCC